MREFDLLIVGAGSGNSILTPHYDDWNVAIVEEGAFGGTCLNRGCIPSKMFVYAAEVANLARRGPRYGVASRVDGVDWPAIRDRVFDRIDPIAESGLEYRQSLDNVTVYTDRGRFVDHKVLEVGGERITADQIVLAAGARVNVPPIPGLDSIRFHTSDDIMRLDRLPESMVILGGGYIAAELGNVFDAFGVDVHFVLRGERFLRSEDPEISERFTDIYRARFDTHVRTRIDNVAPSADGAIRFRLSDADGVRHVEAETFLLATGRVPNGDSLGVTNTGVELDEAGYVIVDEHGRTGADGIWAIGDIANPDQLKHVANADARVVAHNIVHPNDLITVDLGEIPHAVFADPQVASFGLTEPEVRERGMPFVSVTQPYGAAAYGWAMEDTESVCKIIAHAETRLILGAHLLGPQAPTLIQQLIQGARFGQTVDEMARNQYYIHPAMPEVVEQALLEL